MSQESSDLKLIDVTLSSIGGPFIVSVSTDLERLGYIIYGLTTQKLTNLNIEAYCIDLRMSKVLKTG